MRPVWDERRGRTASSRSRSTRTSRTTREATLDAGAALPRGDRPAEPLRQDPGDEGGAAARSRSASREGKSINVTLIFSLERYAEVVEAYIRGLERLVEAGGDLSKVVSVASFFVSRVDTEADRRLEEIGTEALDAAGKLAIANAKLAYEHYKAGLRGRALGGARRQGRAPQRCLWASTSTKNPEYRDVIYVEELIGPETVNTMPLETITRLPGSRRGARRHDPRGPRRGARGLRRLRRGAASTTTTSSQTLEDEGVQKFSDAFAQLIDGIRATRARSDGA